MKLSDKAIDLILQFEIGGSRKYYDRYLARPSWPGGASGVTIGIGYDLGYSSNTFEHDWKDKLSSDAFARLSRTLGLTGSRGKAATANVRDIIISWEDAMEVFESCTLPLYFDQTLDAFPNADKLPPDAFGALVSIVFNRGPLIDNSDRRKEMKRIREILLLGNDDTIDNDDIREIAAQVKSMARLWPDNTKSDNDLHDRRIAESELILSSI